MNSISTHGWLRASARLSAALLVGSGLAWATGTLPAAAHHGWDWAEKQKSEMSGTITATRLGNPHGEVTMDVQGASWRVEVGQPWRNERAGLKDAMFAKGTALTVYGNKSSKKGERRIKAVSVKIGDKTYDLYPERK